MTHTEKKMITKYQVRFYDENDDTDDFVETINGDWDFEIKEEAELLYNMTIKLRNHDQIFLTYTQEDEDGEQTNGYEVIKEWYRKDYLDYESDTEKIYEDDEDGKICFKCNRSEKDCQENTDSENNPITQWVGICGLLCDDCYYAHYADEEDDEDVNSGGSDGEDYSTNISIANY